jgi:hypothetical protein
MGLDESLLHHVGRTHPLLQGSFDAAINERVNIYLIDAHQFSKRLLVSLGGPPNQFFEPTVGLWVV